MKYDFTLTPEQQVLVEQNLSLVDKTISRYINCHNDSLIDEYQDKVSETSNKYMIKEKHYDKPPNIRQIPTGP